MSQTCVNYIHSEILFVVTTLIFFKNLGQSLLTALISLALLSYRINFLEIVLNSLLNLQNFEIVLNSVNAR